MSAPAANTTTAEGARERFEVVVIGAGQAGLRWVTSWGGRDGGL